jgi:GT2 family glycosyltransferase
MKLSVITPTHNPKWLHETWASLRGQTHRDFEWVVTVNDKEGNQSRCAQLALQVKQIVGEDPRVRILVDGRAFKGVGQRKRTAFLAGTGEALIELDHDDLLTPDALAELDVAFRDPDVGFVYSDFADFDEHGPGPQGRPDTYLHPAQRPKWEKAGFTFYHRQIEGVRPGTYECVAAFPPTAHVNALIFHAPNHVRAWRRSVYEKVGGHNEDLPICDDHELVLRTFLVTRQRHISKPLYLYRWTNENTFNTLTPQIETLSYQICAGNMDALALRHAQLANLPAFDLGGAFNSPKGWHPVDIQGNVATKADLRLRWPWADNSVGAFRAYDFLEHLPDKQHTMSEIHRCLAPGGWLVSSTPSTDGRGAFMDPTHVSYWNQNSFWYWTMREHASYIGNSTVKFSGLLLFTSFPTEWHKKHAISYVQAALIAVKQGYRGPGEPLI